MYVCGITPYDATHMGHAATYVAFDLLVRALRDADVDLHYVQNVTDIDDPLLERATALGVDWQDLAREQTELFTTDMDALRVIAPDTFIGAVESIPLVVDAVENLLVQGKAYRVSNEGEEGIFPDDPGDVYLDLTTDPKFGEVSQYSRGQMLELFGERGGDPQRRGKRNPLDPLLWRQQREGEPSWEGGELGRGRPGWHIECAVIANKYLDAPFDVQGGGNDLIFPHHEMSSNHVRLAFGDDRAPRVHAHGGMMAFEGEKMSKSLGNLVLVSRLRDDGVDPMAIRLALLAGHYRADREWTPQLLQEATDRLSMWRALANADAAVDVAALRDEVRAALADDLDSPTALQAIDRWVSTNQEADGSDEKVDNAPAEFRDLVDALLGVEL